jgi:hypothetical protein
MIKQLKEKRRLARLRFISEIEQKYLFFDYKKFFLSTLSIHAKRNPDLPRPQRKKKEFAAIRPTEIYHPSEEEGPQTDNEGDRIPPEAYSNNQPL